MADQSIYIEETLSPEDSCSPFHLEILDQFEPEDSFIISGNILEIFDEFNPIESYSEPSPIFVTDEMIPIENYSTPFVEIDMNIIPSDIYNDNTKLTNRDLLWGISNVDFGMPGLKTINSIFLGINGNNFLTIHVDLLYENSDTIRTAVTRTSQNGSTAFGPFTAQSFNIFVFAPKDSGIIIDEFSHIVIEYQTPDRRFRRSRYAITN